MIVCIHAYHYWISMYYFVVTVYSAYFFVPLTVLEVKTDLQIALHHMIVPVIIVVLLALLAVSNKYLTY